MEHRRLRGREEPVRLTSQTSQVVETPNYNLDSFAGLAEVAYQKVARKPACARNQMAFTKRVPFHEFKNLAATRLQTFEITVGPLTEAAAA